MCRLHHCFLKVSWLDKFEERTDQVSELQLMWVAERIPTTITVISSLINPDTLKISSGGKVNWLTRIYWDVKRTCSRRPAHSAQGAEMSRGGRLQHLGKGRGLCQQNGIWNVKYTIGGKLSSPKTKYRMAWLISSLLFLQSTKTRDKSDLSKALLPARIIFPTFFIGFLLSRNVCYSLLSCESRSRLQWMLFEKMRGRNHLVYWSCYSTHTVGRARGRQEK